MRAARLKGAQGMVLVITLSLAVGMTGCPSWEPVGPEEAVDIRLEFTSSCFVGPERPRGVAASADYAYVLSSNRLTVVNVSDRRYPIIVGENWISGAKDLAVEDGYVYVVQAWGRLTVYDIQDPGNLRYVRGLSVEGTISGLAVLGNRVYLAVSRELPSGDYSKICIINVSEPAEPEALGESGLRPGWTYAMWVGESKAYLLTSGPRVDLFDISDPAAAHCIGSYWPYSQYAADISVSQSSLCITSDYGVEIADLRSTANGDPAFGCMVELPTYTDCLFSQGHHVYAEGRGLLYALNVQDPANAVVVAECQVGRYCAAVCVEGDWVYRVWGDELNCHLDILRVLRDPREF